MNSFVEVLIVVVVRTRHHLKRHTDEFIQFYLGLKLLSNPVIT